MGWQTIYISACCKAPTSRIKDRLTSRYLRQCGKCYKLVSKSRCTKEVHLIYDAV